MIIFLIRYIIKSRKFLSAMDKADSVKEAQKAMDAFIEFIDGNRKYVSDEMYDKLKCSFSESLKCIQENFKINEEIEAISSLLENPIITHEE